MDKVDVLAVMDEVAFAIESEFQTPNNPYPAKDIRAARAAVAELIEAADKLASDYAWSTRHSNGGYAEDHPLTKLRAALARISP